ncbi:hypothetical protein ApAK_07575 [Thermoplasmatales archaeon AK]|nr:hypothetical protein [Thermoplasmatales archaeon AK]
MKQSSRGKANPQRNMRDEGKVNKKSVNKNEEVRERNIDLASLQLPKYQETTNSALSIMTGTEGKEEALSLERMSYERIPFLDLFAISSSSFRIWETLESLSRRLRDNKTRFLIQYTSVIFKSLDSVSVYNIEKLRKKFQAELIQDYSKIQRIQKIEDEIRKALFNVVVELNKQRWALTPALFFERQEREMVLNAFGYSGKFNKEDIPIFQFLSEAIDKQFIINDKEWMKLKSAAFDEPMERAINDLSEYRISDVIKLIALLMEHNLTPSAEILNSLGTLDLNTTLFLFNRETLNKANIELPDLDTWLRSGKESLLIELDKIDRNLSIYQHYKIHEILNSNLSEMAEHFGLHNQVAIVPSLYQPTSTYKITTKPAIIMCALSDPKAVYFTLHGDEEAIVVKVTPKALLYGEEKTIVVLTSHRHLIRSPIFTYISNRIREFYGVDWSISVPIAEPDIVRYNGPITLLQVWNENSGNHAQQQTTAMQPSGSPGMNIDIGDLSFYKDNREFFEVLSKLIRSDRGYIMVYDGDGTMREALSIIASEIARMRGLSINPTFIENSDASAEWKIVDAGTNLGIYVFGPNLSSSDDDIIRSIRESIKGIVGYNYSVVIIPSDMYNKIVPDIAGGTTIAKFTASKEMLALVNAISFASSGGRTERFGDYRALRMSIEPFAKMLHEAMDWLNEGFPNLDVPDPEEGMEHRRLKAYIARFLIESLKLDPRNEIAVEQTYGKMRPDIYDVSNNIIYDAKTSHGKLPDDEIQELANYYELSPKEIRAVMRPLPLLLDAKRVVNRLKALSNMGAYVPMLDDGFKLIGLDKLFKLIDEKYTEFLSNR